MDFIRQPAVAGTFYPGDAAQLENDIKEYLATAVVPQGKAPKAIIVPHAGYIYSGAVAATAYAHIKAAANNISRVILLGPCHRVAVRGMALSSASAFATPLGEVPIDSEACQDILQLPQVQVFDATHAEEHSLEVHIPFLQVILGQFSLVPLVVGEASADEVAEVLDKLWGEAETLIVISTDLCHYLAYDAAQRLDAITCQAIKNMDGQSIDREQACGRVPLRGLLRLAKSKNMNISNVDLRNSGDSAGDKNRVVGYGSWLLTENG